MTGNMLCLLVAVGWASMAAGRDIDVDAFRQGTLDCMNMHRAQHQVGPLQWNQEYIDKAQNWAQYLIDTGKFEHQGDVGENLWGYSSSNDTPPDKTDAACESWYSEEPLYNYQAGEFSMETGHFTAMVWKGTTDVGVGIANKDGRYVIVADFNPAGNVIGQFLDNVFPKN